MKKKKSKKTEKSSMLSKIVVLSIAILALVVFLNYKGDFSNLFSNLRQVWPTGTAQGLMLRFSVGFLILFGLFLKPVHLFTKVTSTSLMLYLLFCLTFKQDPLTLPQLVLNIFIKGGGNG